MYVYVYVCGRDSEDLHVGVDKVRASLPLASRVSLLSLPLSSRVSLLSLPLASRVSLLSLPLASRVSVYVNKYMCVYFHLCICVCVSERERGFACWS